MSLGIIFIILVTVIILYCILRFVFKREEPFFDSAATQGNYEALRRRLKTMMNSYCQLADFAQNQIKEVYKNPRPSNTPLPNPPPRQPSPPITCDWKDPTCKPNYPTDDCDWKDPKCKPKPITSSRTPDVSSLPMTPGDNDQQLAGRLQQTYNEVYNCSDSLAVSRPACAAKADMLKDLQKNNIDINEIKPPPSVPFVPCNTYLGLPDWPDKLNAAYMLSSIPENLAERVIREVDWYNAIADTLLEAIEKGRNPPESPPDNSSSPARDGSGKEWSADGNQPLDKRSLNFKSRAETWNAPVPRIEGFQSQCSPSAQQTRIERERRKQLEAEAAAKNGGAGGAGGAGGPNPADNPDTCVMPDLDGQIARVNRILDSPALNQALKICDLVLIKLRQAQADLEKAKNGNLFEWQKDPPKKVFAQFNKSGDRAAALTFSMRQNQM